MWALDVLGNYDNPCWPVALEENTWSMIAETAGELAGQRLVHEEGVFSWRGTALKAVRDYRAGRIDREGNPIMPERGGARLEGEQTTARDAGVSDVLGDALD
jgi:hypothetical protein